MQPMPRGASRRSTRTTNEGPTSAAPYEEFSQAWPALHEVTIRWRGSFGYLTASAGEGTSRNGLPPGLITGVKPR